MDYSQYKKQNKRIHQIGISTLIVSVMIGFFAFGFAEDLRFPAINLKTTQSSEFFDNNQNTNQNFEQSKSITALNSDSKIKPQNAKSNNIKQNSVKQNSQSYSENKMGGADEKTKTDELGVDRFILKADGQIYEVTKKLAEPAKLSLILRTTDENFEELDITQTIFTSGNTGIPLDDGTAKIESKNIILDFTSPNSWMPDIVLKGTLGEEIQQDNDGKIGVIFEEQTFFLSDGDTIQTHVNLKGILEVD